MDEYENVHADCVKPGSKSPVADAEPPFTEVSEGETITLNSTEL